MSIMHLDNQTHHAQRSIFLGEAVDIQRYDQVKYQWMERWNDVGLGNFWRPQEVDITKDKADFESLDEHQKFIFASNLKRQIVLDSVQGRAPALAFLPITSLPEAESAFLEWSFQELIHSRSYTHIIRNIYNDPSEVFDHILEIQEIVDLAKDISAHYDTLIAMNNSREHQLNSGVKLFEQFTKEHKRAIWRALNAVNALEGVRFYVSFACSWAFAEVLGKMEGNAKIIRLICRDENEHLKFTQMLLTTLPKDDPDFAEIKEELREEMTQLFYSVGDQEKSWAKYIFQHGDMLGLDENICCQLVDWLMAKRMGAIGLVYGGETPKNNPIPWMGNWISSASLQVAPQETEISSYIISVLDGGVDIDALKEQRVGL